MNLTPRQELFAQTVASGKTQSEAYRTAYPSSLNWLDKTVWEKASAMAANGKVSARISELQTKTRERNEVKIDEILENLAKFLRFNLKSIFNPDGTMKSFDEMTDDEAACIQSFEVTELFSGKGENKRKIGEVKKVKLIDKLGTIDKFFRQMGAYAKEPLVDKDDLEVVRDILKDLMK